MDAPRILIVDDDAAVTRILQRVFAQSGFAPTTVCNGREAIAALATAEYTAMICDIQMPKMNGRELCQHLATAGPYFPDCVCVVTSRTEDEERGWVREYPNVSLVEKPVGPKQLLRLVRAKLRDARDPDADADAERRAA